MSCWYQFISFWVLVVLFDYFLNCLCMCGFLTRLLLIKGFQIRQYMFLDLGSHCSIAMLEALIQSSGVCGQYISYCLLQHMASFYLNISLNGEKNCLVSIHTSILFFFFFGKSRKNSSLFISSPCCVIRYCCHIPKGLPF